MAISEMVLPEFQEEMKNTRKMLALVPLDDPGFKPHPKSMALQHLASHVAELPGYIVSTLTSDRLDMEMATYVPWRAQNTEELLAKFDENVAKAKELISGASDAEWGKMWTFTYNGQQVFSMPKVAVLRGMAMSHLIHHRGQLSVYLRLKDVEIPGMYGPSADEMKFWEAKGSS